MLPKTPVQNRKPGVDPRGGAIGAISPQTPTNVTLFTMILHSSENSIGDTRLCCRLLFCHSSVVKYTSSLFAVVNPQWDFITEIAPLNLLAVSTPAEDKLLFFTNPIWHSTPLCLLWSTIASWHFHLLQCSLLWLAWSVQWLLVVLLFVGWVLWNNKPLSIWSVSCELKPIHTFHKVTLWLWMWPHRAGIHKLLLQPLRWHSVECVIHHKWDAQRITLKYMWCEKAIIEWSWWVTSNNDCEPGEKLTVRPGGGDKSDVVRWSLLLLAATVWSFAHLPLGLSDGNKMVLWSGCEGRVKCSLHKKERVISAVRCKKGGCCCNLSVMVALNVRFTTNGMCVKNNTHIYLARTSNNRLIVACDLYCCLLPKCEALHTSRSSFLISTLPIEATATQ